MAFACVDHEHAGAASRNHLGTTEFYGMLCSVVFGILLVPGLYALFQTWRETAKRFFAYVAATSARRRSLRERKSVGTLEGWKGEGE